ncbi:steroid receptor RNA activator 1-like [Apostichopus japonicus]|uniref:steroid receptor RNA activator 1-like n=1 Tax=Stichopus japonicus TaxID=307972 RepID=UPI003AB6EE4C
MSHSSSGISNRGWNDPPKLQTNSGSQSHSRKQLTQRVTHILPQETSSEEIKDDATAKADVLPLSARRPNLPENFAPPPTSSVSNDSVKTEASCTTSEEGKNADTKADNEDVPSSQEVLSRLQSTLEECQDQLKPRVIDDVKRKFAIFEKSWSDGKLSEGVQLQMSKLSIALSERRYPDAEKIHLNLMMEHISEVSSWMVGIKRLISEAKKILPSETDSLSDENTQESEQSKQQIPFLMPVNS